MVSSNILPIGIGVENQQSPCTYLLVFSITKFLHPPPPLIFSVWQKLETENVEFFRAYYTRLVLKQQIMEFNRLLDRQVELMHLNPTAVASLPTSNGSHIPAVSSLPNSNGSHIPTSKFLPP